MSDEQDFQSLGNADDDIKALTAIRANAELGPAGKYQDPFSAESIERARQAQAPLIERLGTALPMALSGFTPGGTALPNVLARMAFNAGVGGTSEAMQGGSPLDVGKVAGGSALASGALDKLGELARYVGSVIPKKMFDAERAAAIGDYLKGNIPWWSGFDSSHAGIDEMANGVKAKQALSAGYEKAFEAAKDKIPDDAAAVIPDWVARGLKLAGAAGDKLSEGTQAMLRGGEAGVNDVVVNAKALVDKLPGSTGDIRRAIERGLRPIAGEFIPEAQRAYSVGRGWQEAAARGQFLTGGKFDAAKAQAALRNAVGEESMGQAVLAPRGMGELETLINGPLGRASIQESGLLGGVHGGIGAHGWRAWLPQPTVYQNVPPQIPVIGDIGRAGLTATMPGFLSNMLTTGP